MILFIVAVVFPVWAALIIMLPYAIASILFFLIIKYLKLDEKWKYIIGAVFSVVIAVLINNLLWKIYFFQPPSSTDPLRRSFGLIIGLSFLSLLFLIYLIFKNKNGNKLYFSYNIKAYYFFIFLIFLATISRYNSSFLIKYKMDIFVDNASKYSYYSKKAKDLNDINLCERAKEFVGKFVYDDCYEQFANSNYDFERCFKINDPSEKGSCIINITSNRREADIVNYKTENVSVNRKNDYSQEELEKFGGRMDIIDCSKIDNKKAEQVVDCFYKTAIYDSINIRKNNEKDDFPTWELENKFINKEFLENQRAFYSSEFYLKKISEEEKMTGFIYAFCSSAVPSEASFIIRDINIRDDGSGNVRVINNFYENTKGQTNIAPKITHPQTESDVFLKNINGEWRITRIYCL